MKKGMTVDETIERPFKSAFDNLIALQFTEMANWEFFIYRFVYARLGWLTKKIEKLVNFNSNLFKRLPITLAHLNLKLETLRLN